MGPSFQSQYTTERGQAKLANIYSHAVDWISIVHSVKQSYGTAASNQDMLFGEAHVSSNITVVMDLPLLSILTKNQKPQESCKLKSSNQPISCCNQQAKRRATFPLFCCLEMLPWNKTFQKLSPWSVAYIYNLSRTIKQQGDCKLHFSILPWRKMLY